MLFGYEYAGGVINRVSDLEIGEPTLNSSLVLYIYLCTNASGKCVVSTPAVSQTVGHTFGKIVVSLSKILRQYSLAKTFYSYNSKYGSVFK